MTAKMTSSKQRPADSHDLIRVQGARENNLKDVSVEICFGCLRMTASSQDWPGGAREDTLGLWGFDLELSVFGFNLLDSSLRISSIQDSAAAEKRARQES